MKVYRVANGLGPEANRSTALPSKCGSEDVNGAYRTFGDGIEVMVVRRTSRRMKRGFGSE